jgi:ferric-dicitrate binding protein FerR (iron transport regulator)
MRQSVLIPVLFPILLFALISCTAPDKNVSPGGAAIEGKVIGLEGIVLINGSEAGLNSPVPDNAVITTDEDGYCEVTFLGSNIIRIYENSIIKVSFSGAMLAVDRGAAAAILRNIATLLKNEKDLFQVESGNVVAGVRGTSFYFNREDKDTTYFCLCNGAVDVSDPAGRLQLPLTAVHHNAIRIREQDGEISMSRAAMAYHTDKDMENLAARIGQKMDWTRQE